MGYFVNGQCVPTAQSAAALQCGSYPKTAAEGGVVYTWSCTASDGASLSLNRTASDGSAPAAQTLAVSFPPCDELEHYKDLSALWGLFLMAGAVIWSLKNFVLKLVMPQ